MCESTWSYQPAAMTVFIVSSATPTNVWNGSNTTT